MVQSTKVGVYASVSGVRITKMTHALLEFLTCELAQPQSFDPQSFVCEQSLSASVFKSGRCQKRFKFYDCHMLFFDVAGGHLAVETIADSKKMMQHSLSIV
jgi:hypothetical protein